MRPEAVQAEGVAPFALSPALQSIARRRKQRASEESRHKAAAERQGQLIAQARAELREIAQNALEQLQAVDVDVKLEERELSDYERYGYTGRRLGHSTIGASIYLRDDEVAIRMDLWNASEATGIVEGGVCRPGRRGWRGTRHVIPAVDRLDDVLTSLIRQEVDGRLVWRRANGAEFTSDVLLELFDKAYDRRR